jgi:CDP-glucose 4,6-dehydratase
MLAKKLYCEGPVFAEGWNFGPHEESAQSVEWVIDYLKSQWGDGATWQIDDSEHVHEAHFLKLDCSKAKIRLNWHSLWGLEETLSRTVKWYKSWHQGCDMYDYTISEINEYMHAACARTLNS